MNTSKMTERAQEALLAAQEAAEGREGQQDQGGRGPAQKRQARGRNRFVEPSSNDEVSRPDKRCAQGAEAAHPGGGSLLRHHSQLLKVLYTTARPRIRT